MAQHFTEEFDDVDYALPEADDLARGESRGLGQVGGAGPVLEPVPEPPAWHGDVLAERRRRVQSGEEEFMTIAESKRRLREARVYGVLDNRRDPSWIYNHLQESKGVK